MARVSLRIRVAVLCLLALATSPAWARGPYTVCLQPLGRHEASLLAPIARGLEQAYGVPVRQLPARPLPASAWYPPRSRYRASKLLDHLRTEVLPAHADCTAVLGFTSVDVSMTEARLGRKLPPRTMLDWNAIDD
jgi:hypothetical protein